MSDRAELYDRLPLVASDRWWIDLATASPDGRVLELGSGAGRLTAALADAGAKVTAVDHDPAMVARARDRLGGRAEVLQADVRTLPAGPPVGLVVLPASLLNELPDVEARRATLAAAARRCRPDGAVAFHLLGPWWLVGLAGRATGELEPLDGGPTVEVTIEAGAFDPWTARRRARLIYRFPDRVVLADDLDAGVIDPGQLELLLAGAGLGIDERFGAVPPRPPQLDDAAWHVVARPIGT